MMCSISSPVARPTWLISAAILPLLLLGACGGGSDEPEASAAAVDVAQGASATAETSTNPGAAPVSGAPSSAAPVPSGSDGFCGLANFQADLLRRINEARASARTCGGTAYPATASLNWNGALYGAAEGHSRDMAVNNFFSHTGLDGRSVSQRVSAAGYAWRAVGENIAAGQPDVSSVMSGWLASPGHCANIMNDQYRDAAVACVHRSGSTYGSYWTMVLAQPR